MPSLRGALEELPLTKVLLLAAAIRFILAPFFGHPWDTYIWECVGSALLAGKNPYTLGTSQVWWWGYYCYPPPWMLWCAFAYLFHFSYYAYLLVLKIPTILADLGIGLLLFRIASELKNEVWGKRLALAYLFNPVSILISAVWAMFDSIPALLTLLAFYELMHKRYKLSALWLGGGIAVKIYPALFLPFLCYKFWKEKGFRWALKYVLWALSPLAAVSMPFFIADPYSFVSLLILGNAGYVGGMTYWMVLSHFMNSYVMSVVAFSLFAIFYYFIVRDWGRAESPHDLAYAMTAILAAFLVTSPKVNVQYTLWILPFLLVVSLKRRRAYRIVYKWVTAFAALLIVSMAPWNNYYLYAGPHIYTPPPIWLVFGTLIVACAIATPLSMARLLRKGMYLVSFPKKASLKALLATSLSILVGFSIFAFVAPVTAPSQEAKEGKILLAIPESMDSAFNPEANDYAVEDYLKKYSPNATILPWSPDFYNEYGNLSDNLDVYMKIVFSRLSNWTLDDVKGVVRELHARGVKVYLGVFCRAEHISSAHGMMGYRSPWFKRHPEALNGHLIDLSATLKEDPAYGIEEGTPYWKYLSEKAVQAILDVGCDGFAFLYTDYRPPDDVEAYTDALLCMADYFSARGIEFIVTDYNGEFFEGEYEELLPKVSYFIVQSTPWKYTVIDMDYRKTSAYYDKYLKQMSQLPVEERRKVLLALELADMQENWCVPSVYVQSEINKYSSLDFGGYVLLYASKYVTFSVSL